MKPQANGERAKLRCARIYKTPLAVEGSGVIVIPSAGCPQVDILQHGSSAVISLFPGLEGLQRAEIGDLAPAYFAAVAVPVGLLYALRAARIPPNVRGVSRAIRSSWVSVIGLLPVIIPPPSDIRICGIQ